MRRILPTRSSRRFSPFTKLRLGKKLLTEQPRVVDSSMKFAQDWANKLSDLVVAKMRDELKKRGHAL